MPRSRPVIRALVALVLGAVAQAPLAAQFTKPVERPRILRPMPPATAAPAQPAPNNPPPPPPAAQRPPAPAPIAGYEIVAGTAIDVGPLSQASALAQCPAGKIVLAAAYDFSGADDATFGYETKGGVFGMRTYDLRDVDVARVAAVRVRNANVFVRGTVRPSVVCATPPAGLRTVFIGGQDDPHNGGASCTTAERVVGGGAGGRENTLLPMNAPQGRGEDSRWSLLATTAGPGLPGTYGSEGVVLCAPASAIEGWEYVESLPVTLEARSRAEVSVRCPGGKVVLTAGVVQRSSNWLDLVMNRLLIDGAGGARALLHNRNTINGRGSVQAVLAAVCARRA